MDNSADNKVVPTGRERVLKALNYEPVDRVPVDLGGTVTSGAQVSVVAKLRPALGLDKPGEPVENILAMFEALGRKIKS